MKIEKVLEDVEVVFRSQHEAEILSLAVHPGQVRTHSAFLNLAGHSDTSSAIQEAVRKGAAFIICGENDPGIQSIPRHVGVAVVKDRKIAHAILAGNFFGHPARDLAFIGVTGTKGKTTTCHFIHDILQASGIRSALITSAVRRLPDREYRASNTTPEPVSLHRFLREALRQGSTHVVVEASSIGIVEERLHGLKFDALAFTNIGSDHLEYHGGVDEYWNAKRKLFTKADFRKGATTVVVVNGDDAGGEELSRTLSPAPVSVGLRSGDIVAKNVMFDVSGSHFVIENHLISIPLTGLHNVSNALVAFAVTRHFVGASAAVSGFTAIRPVPGRMERINTENGLIVYIDYAHTSESITATLETVASLHPEKRRVGVLGCSGNSDKSKRAHMARAAALRSDAVVFTTDNPNFEHPAAIILQMLKGLEGTGGKVFVALDRGEAIRRAIELALPDGVVILMGKGAERFQLIYGERRPYSEEREVVVALRRMGLMADAAGGDRDGGRSGEPSRARP